MLVAQGKKPTEAYHLAGYEGEGNTAWVAASRLYRNDKVFRAISWFRNQYQKRYTTGLHKKTTAQNAQKTAQFAVRSWQSE